MINITAFYDASYFDPLVADQEKTRRRMQGEKAYTNYAEHGSGVGSAKWQRFSHKGNVESETDAFRDIISGETVDPRILRDLCEGRCPSTHRMLIRRRTVVTGKHKERVAGYDLQISLPKSVSILWAFGSSELRHRIIAAKEAARTDLFQYIIDEGLIVARRDQGGKTKIPVEEIVVPCNDHYFSRAGDMQLHDHNLILSFARLLDGSFAPIDNFLLKRYAGALSALYRASFARHLTRALPIVFCRKERNIEVGGVDPKVIDLFSKRRAVIKKEAEIAGFSTATNRQAAQRIANDTRQRKRKAAAETSLQEGWQKELSSLSMSADDLRWAVVEAAASSNSAARTEGIDPAIAKEALSQAFRSSALLEEPQLLRLFAEELQLQGDLHSVVEAFHLAKASKDIIALGTPERPLFTHADIVELEHRMQLAAKNGMGKWTRYLPHKTRSLRDRFPDLSEEQIAAVKHSLGNDLFAIVQGRAGSGKSYSLGAVADVLRSEGMKVSVVAPSWKAVDVARNDTRTPSDDALAVQGFVAELESGKRSLNVNDAIMVDEAGMVDLKTMSILLQHASAAGTKVILAGDVDQLQPVDAGAPLVSLAHVLGQAKINKIRRQKIDWQREASEDLAAGDMRRALAAYDRNGNIEFRDDPDAVIEAVVQRSVNLHHKQHQNDQAVDLCTQLVLTPRRKDVVLLNAKIRERLVADGVIDPKSATIVAAPRNTRVGHAIEIAVGDRIIFGEKLKLEKTIYNGDFATVLGIVDDGNAHGLKMKVKLDRKADDGSEIVIEETIDNLIGSRKPGEARVPIFQHAYAVTIHAAQGATVDQVTIANFQPMSREQTYVALTRHRHDVKMIVDASRLAGARSADQIKLVHGIAFEREVQNKVCNVPAANLLKKLTEECSRSVDYRSVAVHVPDVERWLRALDPVAELKRQTTPRNVVETVRYVRERAAQRLPSVNRKRPPLWVFNSRERLALAAIEPGKILAEVFEGQRVVKDADQWVVTTNERKAAVEFRDKGRKVSWTMRWSLHSQTQGLWGQGLVSLVQNTLQLTAKLATQHVREVLLQKTLNFMAKRQTDRAIEAALDKKMQQWEKLPGHIFASQHTSTASSHVVGPGADSSTTPIKPPAMIVKLAELPQEEALALVNHRHAAALRDASGTPSSPVARTAKDLGEAYGPNPTRHPSNFDTSGKRPFSVKQPLYAIKPSDKLRPDDMSRSQTKQTAPEAVTFSTVSHHPPVDRVLVASDGPKIKHGDAVPNASARSRLLSGLKAAGGFMAGSVRQGAEDVTYAAKQFQKLLRNDRQTPHYGQQALNIRDDEANTKRPIEKPKHSSADLDDGQRSRKTADAKDRTSIPSVAGQLIHQGLGELLEAEFAKSVPASTQGTATTAGAQSGNAFIRRDAERTRNDATRNTTRQEPASKPPKPHVVTVRYRPPAPSPQGRTVHQEGVEFPGQQHLDKEHER